MYDFAAVRSGQINHYIKLTTDGKLLGRHMDIHSRNVICSHFLYFRCQFEMC